MQLVATVPHWLWACLVVGIALIAAFALHWAIFLIASRWSMRTATTIDNALILRLRAPARWLIIAFALSAVQPGLALPRAVAAAWLQIAGLVFPALLGWVAVALLGFGADVIKERADITASDNLHARRQRTRADILHRISVFVVLLATFCMMLMSIPSVRNIGVTLVASAGLAALAVGAAAQPALKNLIAGFQMAFTEPIRIDDVVIIAGEWGRIEEIRLTYVVVRIWDERRLIVPVSKFLDDSFQNWTRTTSELLGTVFWYLDPATDVSLLREKLGELVQASERWDGRFFNMQVTDVKIEAIEVRALMTAKDASTAFDLRCEIREGLLAFIRSEMPEAITHYRGDVNVRPSRHPLPAAPQ